MDEHSSKFSSIRYEEDDQKSDSAEELDVDFDEVMNFKLKTRYRKPKVNKWDKIVWQVHF